MTRFAVGFLICILIPNHVFSQDNIPNNEIVFGTRTISSPVAGFCYVFRDTLREKLNNSGQGITLRSVSILNQYKGDFYYRYAGLLKDPYDPAHIDIECGPNSVSSGQLINSNSKKPYSEEIAFSKSFYSTGIKLLLQKDLANSLSNSSSINFENNIRALRIGVLEGTTTYEQLRNNSSLYQIVPIGTGKDSNTGNDINPLERTLNALDNNGDLGEGLRIDAFASDAIILQSLLVNGVEGSGEEGQFVHVKERSGYEDKGYVVFPSRQFPSPDGGTYLPQLSQEDYALAIKKGGPNEIWLAGIIEDTLGDLSVSQSKLRKAQDSLKPFETDQAFTTPTPTPSTPTPTPTPTPPPLPPPPGNTDRWWVPLAVAAIGAIATIIAAITGQLGQLMKWIYNLFKPETVGKTMAGRVLNKRNGAWIYGAKVSLEVSGNPPLVKYTDTEGFFQFEFSAQSVSNRVRVRVEADGYEIVDRWIDLSHDGKGGLDIRLVPTT